MHSGFSDGENWSGTIENECYDYYTVSTCNFPNQRPDWIYELNGGFASHHTLFTTTREGQAVLNYFHSLGGQPTACDDKAALDGCPTKIAADWATIGTKNLKPKDVSTQWRVADLLNHLLCVCYKTRSLRTPGSEQGTSKLSFLCLAWLLAATAPHLELYGFPTRQMDLRGCRPHCTCVRWNPMRIVSERRWNLSIEARLHQSDHWFRMFDLLRSILKNPWEELGSHSWSHSLIVMGSTQAFTALDDIS